MPRVQSNKAGTHLRSGTTPVVRQRQCVWCQVLLLPARLEKLNAAIAAGEVKYIDGRTVEQALQEALITEDNKVIYPIEDSIPILLEDKGIGTTQLNDF